MHCARRSIARIAVSLLVLVFVAANCAGAACTLRCDFAAATPAQYDHMAMQHSFGMHHPAPAPSHAPCSNHTQRPVTAASFAKLATLLLSAPAAPAARGEAGIFAASLPMSPAPASLAAPRRPETSRTSLRI